MSGRIIKWRPPDDPPQVQTPWPEPIDILARPNMTGVSSVDETCVPRTIASLALSEGERLGVDPIGIAAAAIGVCSGVLSDSWKVRLKFNDHGWRESPRLWVCLLADSGSKKSEQIRSAVSPVYAIQAKARDRHMIEMARWTEDHQRWKKEGKKAGDPEPQEPRMSRTICSDFTVEALSERLAKDANKMLVVCDELAQFLGMFERYSGAGKVSSSRGHMLSAYEGGPHMVDRVQRGTLYIPNWSISMIGGIQPDRIRGMVSDLASDGLLQRMMMIRVPPVSLAGEDDDRPRDPSSTDAYAELVRKLKELHPTALDDGVFPDIRCHEDDKDEVHRLRREVFKVAERVEMDGGLPAGLRQSASKWRGTLARVAAVYHCIRVAEEQPYDRHRLMPETVAMAARFVVRIVIPSTFQFYLDGQDDGASIISSARWIAEHILAHQHAKVTRRDIGRASVGLRGESDKIVHAMEVLTDAGWCRPNAYSAFPEWEINPVVHTRFADLAKHHRRQREHTRQLIRQSVAERVRSSSEALDG